MSGERANASYLESLSAELARVGIVGGRRRRILAEFEDHLACDPGGQLGAPRQLARGFADELGTALARRAAWRAFAALAVAGALFGAAFISARSVTGELGYLSPSSPLLGSLAGALVLVGTQLAFVAGTLALLRAVRRRGEAVIPRAEAAVLVRRAALGLAAGGATMAGLALLTAEYGHAVAGWWSTFALAAAGAGSLALGAAVPSLVRAGRVRPEAEGERGDIFDDLPQMVARWSGRSPWALALAIAGGLALVIALAGAAQSDGIDGIARGLADGLACLTGFALLGGFLGLRRATPAR